MDVSRAEEIPFAEGSFDVVACRVAAHHFDDVQAAMRELARVARDRVLVVDNLYLGEQEEEADRVRDPSHVRNYSEDEWRGFFEAAGFRVEVARFVKPIELEPWLERVGCRGKRRSGCAGCCPPDRRRPDHARPDRAQGTEVMAIIVDSDTRLVVQGLTGSEGRFHGTRNSATERRSSPA